MGNRKHLKDKVYQSGQWLELIISILIAIAICFYAIVLAFELIQLIVGKNPNIEDLNGFINLGFGLVIGIEFIKMLCKHSPAIIVEVLVFAVARQMIVEHTTPIQNLVSIGCIAMLFAIRRFLFFEFDATEHMIFSPKEPAIEVNHLLNVNIPIDNVEDTLYDVFCKHCAAEQITKGVCVYFSGCALRIAKVDGKEISEIEVVQGAQTHLMPDK
ncbi:MAG: hypothetical protein Q4D45_09940 [Lachnospiraceae bacterium]|nr:hypothetical protein [Lachnospiraceae bacterium]